MPNQYPVQPERYAERLKRLEKLISLNAPPIIIDGECKLVIGAVHGSYYRALWSWFKQRVRGDIRWHYDTLRYRLKELFSGKTREEICDEEADKIIKNFEKNS